MACTVPYRLHIRDSASDVRAVHGHNHRLYNGKSSVLLYTGQFVYLSYLLGLSLYWAN